MTSRFDKLDPISVATTFPLHNLLQGWYFRLRETSAGCYAAEGTDLWGHRVSCQGDDQQKVLGEVVEQAKSLTI